MLVNFKQRCGISRREMQSVQTENQTHTYNIDSTKMISVSSINSNYFLVIDPNKLLRLILVHACERKQTHNTYKLWLRYPTSN